MKQYGAFFRSDIWRDLVRRACEAEVLPPLETKDIKLAVKRCEALKRQADKWARGIGRKAA